MPAMWKPFRANAAFTPGPGDTAGRMAYRAVRRGAQGAALAAAVLLSACSSVRPWINEPMPATEQAVYQHISSRDPTILVAVTLSGGGARAAAFGFGVLTEMQETRFQWNGHSTTLLDATDVVSGVSGGSIVAAYFAAHGIDGLPRFEQDFLRQNFQPVTAPPSAASSRCSWASRCAK